MHKVLHSVSSTDRKRVRLSVNGDAIDTWAQKCVPWRPVGMALSVEWITIRQRERSRRKRGEGGEETRGEERRGGEGGGGKREERRGGGEGGGGKQRGEEGREGKG